MELLQQMKLISPQLVVAVVGMAWNDGSLPRKFYMCMGNGAYISGMTDEFIV